MLLHRIIADAKSLAELENRPIFGKGSKRVFRQILVKRINLLVTEAMRAYQSKIPVDTEELRRGITCTQANASNLEADVVLDEFVHQGARKTPTQSSVLAEILDNGVSDRGSDLHRTRDSIALSGYSSIARRSPTRGWIKSARVAFNNRRRSL